MNDKDGHMRSHFLADACGVIGIFGGSTMSDDLSGGLHALQHRGQKFSGAGVARDEGLRVFSEKGLVEGWTSSKKSFLEGDIGIGHVGMRDPQPVKHRSRFGELAVCFSGHLRNSSEVLADMLADGRSFAEGSQTEVLSKVIGSRPDVTQGLEKAFQLFTGAFSLLVMTRDAIYAARDPRGIRPLMLGWRQAQWAVASESRALSDLEFQLSRDIEPGEVVRIDIDGVETCSRIPSPRRAHCAFEWAYIAAQDSKIEGVWVRDARKRMGEALAAADHKAGLRFDVVAPVPRSGIGSALGYHAAGREPYDELFLDLRSFRWQDDALESPSYSGTSSLSVVVPAVRNRRIVLCDDSLVRGAQIKRRIKELRAAGAKEVHVRIACPPLIYPCDYGSSDGKAGEFMARQLIAHKDMDREDALEKLEHDVARLIGGDTLRFNNMEKFVDAIGLDRKDLCLKCFDGINPEAVKKE